MKNTGNYISLFLAAVMTAVMLSGCDGIKITLNRADGDVTIAPAEGSKEAEPEQETTYFTKGVYVNYAAEAQDPPLTYFYVFTGDSYGYTADGENEGIGLPFDTEQTDGTVRFLFGSEEETPEILTVTSAKDGVIEGYFEGAKDRPLVFERMEGIDPETFRAENYVNGQKDSVYHDANGWSVRYDATKFEITQEGPQVFIVNTGESAGTNMITVTYTVENGGEAAIRELGESWGEETEYSQGTFPGADDVTGYWAVLPPKEEGSGLYMTAIGRDYMDGALIFELTGHNGDDEEMNMAVSDDLASVIDSLTFETYGE